MCQVTFNDTTDIVSEPSSTLGSETSVGTQDQSTEPQDMSSMVNESTTTEEDDQETDNVRYNPEEADNTTTTTTSTEQPKPQPASTSAPGHASSVATPASALAVTLALCAGLLFQNTRRRVVDC